MVWCFGRQCKLGWGYNAFFDHLIPIEGEPLNITSETKYYWNYPVIDLLSMTINSQVNFFD